MLNIGNFNQVSYHYYGQNQCEEARETSLKKLPAKLLSIMPPMFRGSKLKYSGATRLFIKPLQVACMYEGSYHHVASTQ